MTLVLKATSLGTIILKEICGRNILWKNSLKTNQYLNGNYLKKKKIHCQHLLPCSGILLNLEMLGKCWYLRHSLLVMWALPLPMRCESWDSALAHWLIDRLTPSFIQTVYSDDFLDSIQMTCWTGGSTVYQTALVLIGLHS